MQQNHIARMCDHGHSKMEDVLFQRNGLQVHLNATALHLFDARNSLTLGHEQLRQHSRSQASYHLRIEMLLLRSFPSFLVGLLAS